MRISKWLLPHIVVLSAIVPGVAVAQAALKDAVPHITVFGRAQTEVVPDIAILTLAIVSERPKAEDAAAANARATQALVGELKSQNIDARDIKTASITLTPIYETMTDAVGHTSKSKLTGYSARNALEVRVRALDTAGALARRLIDAGANELEGISYDYTHEDQVYDRLRDQAMQDALRRAKDYLPSTGMTVGRLLEVTPMGADAERLRGVGFGLARAESPEPVAIPIEPGTLTLDAEVQVTWELTAK